MPLTDRTLNMTAIAQVSAAMFAPTEPECFGVELEWPAYARGDLSARPGGEDVARLEGILPGGGRITFEPGGQVELSTAPAGSVGEALRLAEADMAALWSRMDERGLACRTLAVDGRPPRRVLRRPRYEAMERFFAVGGPAGTWMMCNTASTQVNISHDQADPHRRWHTLHLIAPVLVAAFANSPGLDGAGRRWASLRQGIWWSIDPGRTRTVRTDLPPEQAWQQYALAADVMFINTDPGNGADGLGAAAGGAGIAVPPGLSFSEWMRRGHAAGWPTIEDYRYHLSTLFPPVRPRGWLELRVLDTLPGTIREAAVLAVATACTAGAGAELVRRLPDTSGLWQAAARGGLAHPELALAANVMADVIADHLGAVTADPRHHEVFEEYAARYPRRGRTPGDELLPLADGPDLHREPAWT